MNALCRPVILVIDPDGISLTAISAMLASSDFQVYCAQDREAALKGARDLPLDLIICDEDIDESRGAMLVMELRALPDRYDVPIMYMSERQLPDIISRPHDGAVAYHIKKPLDPKLMLEMVSQAVTELPLINSQVTQEIKAPHFPTALGASPDPANSSWMSTQ